MRRNSVGIRGFFIHVLYYIKAGRICDVWKKNYSRSSGSMGVSPSSFGQGVSAIPSQSKTRYFISIAVLPWALSLRNRGEALDAFLFSLCPNPGRSLPPIPMTAAFFHPVKPRRSLEERAALCHKAPKFRRPLTVQQHINDISRKISGALLLHPFFAGLGLCP